MRIMILFKRITACATRELLRNCYSECACVSTAGALAILGDYRVFLSSWGKYLETDRGITSLSFRHISFI